MPMHDWTRVDAGICHAFHHEWISEIHRAVMKRLPEDYYSLLEQQAAGFGPDILTLKFYECDDRVRTYLEPLAVGNSLPDMPVFLYPGMYIDVPLETTYLAAWEAVPRRWQKVIAAPNENI